LSVAGVLRARGAEARGDGAGRSQESEGGLTAPSAIRQFAVAALLAVSTFVLGLAGCGLSEDLQQNPLTLVATPVPLRVQLPNGDTIERRLLVDGEATDPEWSTVPYQYVAMGPEFGNGGGSFVAAVKVAHDSARVYILVQWPDETPNNIGPRLVFAPNRGLNPNDCDSLLVTCSWQLVDQDEDRVAVMWDMGNAADGGGTFTNNGCQVACHGSMHPLSGAVDIWQWRAARTNSIQYPIPGTNARVGFAEDGYADGTSRRLDPGTPFYRNNYRWVDCAGGGRAPVPLELPVGLDVNGQPTTRNNDFMRPCEFVFDPSGVQFTVCSRINPCRQFNQDDVESWVAGDDLSAFLTNRPASETQRRSLHDVEARGSWVGTAQGAVDRGVWTVEMSRLMNTGNSDDLSFQPGRAEPYHMALAVMNNAGKIHSGSPVIEVTFQP
jgi:hypothetical protein